MFTRLEHDTPIADLRHDILLAADLMAELRMKPASFYKALREGRLPPEMRQIDSKRRWLRADVEAWKHAKPVPVAVPNRKPVRRW